MKSLRQKFRFFRILIEEPEDVYHYIDVNIVEFSHLPHSLFIKKHYTINYLRVWVDVAAGIIWLAKIDLKFDTSSFMNENITRRITKANCFY